MKRENWIKSTAFLGAGMFIGYKGIKYIIDRKEFNQLTIGDHRDYLTPTLFIHGTNGTRQSFGGMIERFMRKREAYKALEIIVSKNGVISLTGNWEEKVKHRHPIIQVLFRDNVAEEWKQAKWLKKVMNILYTDLSIERVNLVGHSVGGTVALRYLLDCGNNVDVPTTKKFIAIGSPFNGETVSSNGRTPFDLTREGPLHITSEYRYFDTYKQNISPDLLVLNLYGDLANGSRSDGLVSIDSARSLRFLLKENVAYYREKKFMGLAAQHSLLHENSKVDKAVKKFLWE